MVSIILTTAQFSPLKHNDDKWWVLKPQDGSRHVGANQSFHLLMLPVFAQTHRIEIQKSTHACASFSLPHPICDWFLPIHPQQWQLVFLTSFSISWILGAHSAAQRRQAHSSFSSFSPGAPLSIPSLQSWILVTQFSPQTLLPWRGHFWFPHLNWHPMWLRSGKPPACISPTAFSTIWKNPVCMSIAWLMTASQCWTVSLMAAEA